MIPLVDFMLLCGVCYVGMQAFGKRSAKKNASWLVQPVRSPAPPGRLPFSTRLYIIRCWNERTRQGNPDVMRYTLEDPASGRRYGYSTAEALIHTLLLELTNAPEEPRAPEPTTITPRHALIT